MDDIGNVSAKSGKRLFDGLFIADIGKYILKKAQLRTGLSGNMEPALSHDDHQSHGLECDSLAARVRPGDDHGKSLLIELDIDGDDGLRIEQGMARLQQFNGGAGV